MFLVGYVISIAITCLISLRTNKLKKTKQKYEEKARIRFYSHISRSDCVIITVRCSSERCPFRRMVFFVFFFYSVGMRRTNRIQNAFIAVRPQYVRIQKCRHGCTSAHTSACCWPRSNGMIRWFDAIRKCVNIYRTRSIYWKNITVCLFVNYLLWTVCDGLCVCITKMYARFWRFCMQYLSTNRATARIIALVYF